MASPVHGPPLPTGSTLLRVRTESPSLVTSAGVRGIYLNQLDRTRAASWGAAFASILWDERPRMGRAPVVNPPKTSSPDAADAVANPDAIQPGAILAVSPPARKGPVVVIGMDERPSSPDIVMGVAHGLRRMGCHVIDLGQSTRPCFHFAVHHLEAAGGIFVTGDGHDPAFTGFHFAGRGAVPWLEHDRLVELERRAKSDIVRPTRTAGMQRPFHASIPYQAGLWKLFHALRPLQIACGTSTRQLPRELDVLFSKLPCRLTHESLPQRHRRLDDPHDPDIRRVATATLNGPHHLGVIMDDDGERCAFVTEQGKLVSVTELARLLIRFELHEHRAIQVVIDESLHPALANLSSSVCRLELVSRERLPNEVLCLNAQLGIGADHRLWFGGAYPACNAIQSLARVLQALSLSDAPMSQLLAQAG